MDILTGYFIVHASLNFVSCLALSLNQANGCQWENDYPPYGIIYWLKLVPNPNRSAIAQPAGHQSDFLDAGESHRQVMDG
jgi:hypothetical protein